MKRVRNLFPQLISDENLRQAIIDVNASHRWFSGHKPNPCTAWVELTMEDRIKDLRRIIQDGFVPGEPKVSTRWDCNAKKYRTISEPPLWPDQYVHHALIQVLKPIMMRGMDPYCCGSIEGRGSKRVRESVERWMRKDRKGTKYCLSCDIRHCYDETGADVVMRRLSQLIKDHAILSLAEAIIRQGLKIGYYTSQWFVNTTLQPLDRLIRRTGFARHYIRYMDNFTILSPNRRKLKRLKAAIESWLASHGYELKGDWQIFSVRSRIPTAVGYRYGRTYTILRKGNLLRLRRAMARYWRRQRCGRKTTARMAQGLISRLSQLDHCSATNLYRELFRGAERVQKRLKDIIRRKAKEEKLTWSMYLAQTMRQGWRCSGQKGQSIPA